MRVTLKKKKRKHIRKDHALRSKLIERGLLFPRNHIHEELLYGASIHPGVVPTPLRYSNLMKRGFYQAAMAVRRGEC